MKTFHSVLLRTQYYNYTFPLRRKLKVSAYFNQIDRKNGVKNCRVDTVIRYSMYLFKYILFFCNNRVIKDFSNKESFCFRSV